MTYAIVITKLSDEDGGGFLGLVPDLPGCMSDGATEEEALANAKAAMADWIECQIQMGRKIPPVGSAAKRALEDRQRLVNAIQALSQGYEGIEQRLDEIECDLADVREQLENDGSWLRFSALTGLESPKLGRRAEKLLSA